MSAASRLNIQSIPTLRQFMSNAKSLALYRKALRITQPLSPVDREEVRIQIRNEFELCRNAREANHIAFLQSSGKRRIEQLETQISMQR